MDNNTGSTAPQRRQPGEVERDNDAAHTDTSRSDDGKTTAQQTGRSEGDKPGAPGHH